MTSYITVRDLCSCLFPSEMAGIEVPQRGAVAADAATFCKCDVGRVAEFYRTLQTLGFVRLVDPTRGEWHPVDEFAHSFELINAAERAGVNLDERLHEI